MLNKLKSLEKQNAIIYCRVSTQEQGKGTSLDEQKTACKEICKYYKMNIMETFTEKASAMKGGKRPLFNKVVQMLKEGAAKILVCAYSDRLTRNGTDGDTIKELIEDYGITVVIVHSNRIIKAPVDPTDYLMFELEIAFSNYRVRIDRVRCNSGIVAKNMGGTRTAKPPYGYMYDNDTREVVVVEKRADFVRKAFELLATGEYSVKEVCEELSRLDFHYDLQPDGIIPKQSLISMLKNTFYMGEYLVKQTDEYVQGKHEPIISKDIFEEVQKILSSSPKAPRKHDLLYSRLITCSGCGHYMTGDVKQKPNGKRYVYYRCTNPQCDERYSVNETSIDTDVAAYLSEIQLGLIPDEIVAEVLNDELRLLVQELSTLQRNKSRKYHAEQRLQSKFEKNDITDEKYIQSSYAQIQEKYGDLDAKIYVVEKQIEMVNAKVAELCGMPLSKVYSTFDDKNKRKVLELITNLFKYSENGIKITFKPAFRKLRKR